jgi:hypothetical protein
MLRAEDSAFPIGGVLLHELDAWRVRNAMRCKPPAPSGPRQHQRISLLESLSQRAGPSGLTGWGMGRGPPAPAGGY